MFQQPAYAIGARYIRIRETGSVFPVHAEQLKMVKKDLADLVEWNGKHFFKVDLSTPIKEEVIKIVAPTPEMQTPPPMTQSTFDPPAAPDPREVQIAALQQQIREMQAAGVPAQVPAEAAQMPPVKKVELAVPPTTTPVGATSSPATAMPPVKKVDLLVEPPPSE